ncbi:hypothetical protein, partial [Stenotrophomonas ginsengisoli]|uniref:hypothetical protein n=1 Tax=Stenotrophomonas ginsengisoli TaxID=336566 RepID=UPI001B80ABA9
LIPIPLNRFTATTVEPFCCCIASTHASVSVPEAAKPITILILRDRLNVWPCSADSMMARESPPQSRIHECNRSRLPG